MSPLPRERDRLTTRAAAVLLACVVAPPLPAQQSSAPPPTVRAARTTAPLRLDGIPDEPVWVTADSITEFTQREPEEGAPSPERTVARFVATDAGLWIAFWASEIHERGIRRAQLRRDADFDSDDRVGVVLDPLLDHRSGYQFIVNPNGALYDAEIRGTEHVNEDWNGVWDARAAVSSAGWTAELFIPWQTLRYPRSGDAWGLNAGRFIRHANTEALWRGWRRQQGFTYELDEGLLTGLAPLPPRAPLELRPYALGRVRSATRTYLASGADSVTVPSDAAARFGLDAKFAAAPTLTLDLTANTDFAQVEADRQVVNLSRFPLFFPEKRPFFLESAGIFDFGQSQRTVLFYSRRVGLDAATGEPIPIVAGARLSGRLGRERVGLLALRTGGSEDALDAVARVKHDVFSRGYVGGILTAQGGPGVAGTRGAGGLDVELPLLIGGQNIVPSGYIAWTGATGTRAASAWRVFVDYPNDWSDDFLAVNRVDAGFDPSLGFVVERGYWRHTGQFSLRPRPHRLGIRRLDFKLIEWDVTTNLDGSPSHASYEVTPLGVSFQSDDEIEINLMRRTDAPPDSFELFPGHAIAPGRYGWNRYEVGVATSPARPVSVELQWQGGQFYTGSGEELEYGLAARVAPHLIAALDGNWTWVRLAGGRFTAAAHRIRLDYAVTPRLANTIFVQYDNESDRFAVNARVHWTMRPGSDAYVVWNSAWPTGLAAGVPWRRPLRGALIAKLVWYLRW